jgi:uncharacterized membrane protein YhaH (DUF805 family)
MNAYKKYIAYLKDNPEGYWFKRKLYGWGWTPAKPEGWFVLIAYGAFIIFVAARLESQEITMQDFFAPLAISTMLLIWICYIKGEKPRWQWGERVDD